MDWSKRICAAFLFIGAVASSAAETGAESASDNNENDVEYIVVLSEVAVWEDTIPSDKDMKIYFDVDKGMSYLFALYADAVMDIYTPYGLWQPSTITDPDVAAEVENKLPADGSYHMLPSGGYSAEYYLILTKKERNKRAPFKIVQYTVYKFEKPEIDEGPAENETDAPIGAPESDD
jgi:hypothetical protein